MPLLMITGHQRSGTTILRILLNSHPDFAITNEMANFKHLRKSRLYYSVYIIGRILKSRRRSAYVPLHRNEITSWGENARFHLRYLFEIQKLASRFIGFPGAEAALHRMFPGRRWVGDKFPDYIWSLRYFSSVEELRCIVIYRDARDVVSSTLRSVATEWKHEDFARAFDTPEKVAHRWMKSIELMDACSGKILPVRYEQLLREPKAVAEELGRALDVDPAGFPIHLLRDSSIGKFRSGLDPQALAVVESIAGETLARLGYT